MSLPRDDASRRDDGHADSHRKADELLLSPTTPLRHGGRRRIRDDSTDPITPEAHVPTNRLTPRQRTGETSSTSGDRHGQRIGDYEIIDELARGGMGIVYKAYQSSLKRTVALKMILRADYARLEDFIRFRTEALAIARLHHPNLVSIFEIGEHDGLPFYAMEYLEGGSLAGRIHRQPLDPKAAVQLMLPVVEAIEYAHSRGIIHRDLKPANILLSEANLPLERCVPKVTDFGIAKQVGGIDHLTRTGDILGTPSYMAPEQAIGRASDVGPAADVYSLGAILYETLTGQSPFFGADGADTILQVIHAEPTSPRKLNTHVSADLETICLKCLEKDPARRYLSAEALASDLRRFLSNVPILARPSSPAEKVRKWTKRRPVFATALAAGVALAIVAFASIVARWQQALATAAVEADLVRAKEKNLVETKTLLADALLERGIGLAEKHDVRRGMHWMLRSLDVANAVADRDPRAGSIEEAVRYNLAHWGQFATAPPLMFPHEGWVWAVGFSPDGRHAVTGGRDRSVRVWNTITGQIVGESLKHSEPVWDAAFHPSGKLLFAAGGEQRGEIRTYKINPAGRFERVGDLVAPHGSVRKLILAPGGKFVVALLHDGSAIVYAVDPLLANPLAEHALAMLGGCTAADFSADGSRLYLATQAGTIRTFDLREREFLEADWNVGAAITVMTLSNDRMTLAVAVHDRIANQAAIHLWDLAVGRKKPQTFACRGFVKTLAFAPNDQQIAISALVREGKNVSGEVRLLEIDVHEGLSEIDPPLAHASPVWSLAFDPLGQILITGCEDGRSRLWSVATGESLAPPVAHEGNVVNLAISRDGKHLLTASAGGNATAHARLHELPRLSRSPRVFERASPMSSVQWHDDGKQLMVRHQDKSYSIWDWRSGRMTQPSTLAANEFHVQHLGQPRHVWAHDRTVDRMHVFDPASGAKIQTLPDFPVHWEDANAVQVAGFVPLYHRVQKQLVLVRVADGARHGTPIDLPEIPQAYFAHQDQKLFGVITWNSTQVGPGEVVLRGSTVKIWDTAGNLQRTWTLKDRAYGAMFAPRGDALALYNDSQVKVLDIATGDAVGPAISHAGHVHSWFFHPSGDVLGFGVPDGSVLLWHTKTSKPIGKALTMGTRPAFLTACPDGSGFLGASDQRRTVFWKHLPPARGSVDELRTWVENLTGTTLDANDELQPIDPLERQRRRDSAAVVPIS